MFTDDSGGEVPGKNSKLKTRARQKYTIQVSGHKLWLVSSGLSAVAEKTRAHTQENTHKTQSFKTPLVGRFKLFSQSPKRLAYLAISVKA